MTDNLYCETTMRLLKMIGGLITVITLAATNPENTLKAQSEHQYRPQVGAVHPDFELPSIDDQSPIKLSDFRGKRILLFHFASW